MELFNFLRVEDESGVSGTGLVAQGVVFDDGTTVVKWLTEGSSINIYHSKETMERIHGHGGKTKIVTAKQKRRKTEEITN
jgi:hypothetical protein